MRFIRQLRLAGIVCALGITFTAPITDSRGEESLPPLVQPGGVASDRSVGWKRTGELGPIPNRVSDSLPLSDQQNAGNWRRVPEFTDEFAGDALDSDRWSPRHRTWQGRPPARFDESNVAVHDGMLCLTMRKTDAPPVSAKRGYHTYTSAAVQGRQLAHYGYYEVRAKPMDSAGSSSFWFAHSADGWRTEIDVFELGGRGSGYETKYNMNLHVFHTPTEKRHWSRGATWKAPFRFADEFHTFGVDWSREEVTYYVDGVTVRRIENTHWHQPLYVIFDSETMPDWFGLPEDGDLPSTYRIDYLRVWKRAPRSAR